MKHHWCHYFCGGHLFSIITVWLGLKMDTGCVHYDWVFPVSFVSFFGGPQTTGWLESTSSHAATSHCGRLISALLDNHPMALGHSGPPAGCLLSAFSLSAYLWTNFS